MFNKIKNAGNAVSGLVNALDTIARLAKYAAAVGDVLQYASERFQQVNATKTEDKPNENSEHTS